MRKAIFFTNLIAVSTVLGMQGNLSEKNRSLSKNPMRPVNAENLSASVKSYETLTDQEWISKIVRMRLNEDDFNAPQNTEGQTILMCATKDADVKIMRQILNVRDSKGNRQININAQDKNGNTALSIAAKKGDEKKLLLLLTNGADVELAKKKLLKQAIKKLKRLYEEVQQKNVEFLAVVSLGDHKLAESLLESGEENVNAQDNKYGLTALMVAADYGHNKVVELLLKRPNIDVNAQDKEEHTALMMAADKGHDKVVELLLKHKNIDVNEQNTKGATALMFAMYNGHDKVVELLLEHKNIDVNAQDTKGATALIVAAQRGRDKAVKLLLEHKNIDVNAQDTNGATALIFAAQNGHDKVVELLLKHKNIDANAQDTNGATALMMAARNGHDKVVELLLEHKNIDVNLKDSYGNTALMFAAQKGHDKVVELLLEHKNIDVNAQDTDGATALMFAAQKGRDKAVKLLLEHKNIDVNLKDSCGNTALIFAARNGCDEVVKLLLKYPGIEIGVKDNQGLTAFVRSIQLGHEEIVKQFLEKGVDVNKEYTGKFTALMYAVEGGYARIVNLLLKQYGINIHARNADGETALDCAKRKGRGKIIGLIQSKMEIRNQQFDPFIEQIQTALVDEIHKRFWNTISRGDINEMDSLLDEKGKVLVDVDAKNEYGDTALIIASSNGNLTAVKWLLENEADLSIKDRNGDNALIRVAKKGHLDVVDELLFRKANINSVGQHKKTALMAAAENSQLRVVKLLLKKGAKVSVKNDYGKTALDIVNEKIKKLGNSNNNYDSIKKALEKSLKNQSNQSSLLLNNEAEIENNWKIVIDKAYEKDLKDWEQNDPSVFDKIKQLVDDIKFDPFRGVGRVERLMGDLEGLYSRRINKQNRLVYEIDGEKVILKSCKGHYEKDKRNRSRTNSEK